MHEILVVEDEVDFCEAVQKLLTGAGYHVVATNSGPEACRLIENHPPDLILTDIRMPEVNGLQLLQKVRNNVATASTQVIMLTAINDQELVREAMLLGADDFLTKPAGKDEILAAVSSRLKRGRDYHQDFAGRVRRQQDLLSMIAHDFRGPLTTIRLALYALNSPMKEMEDTPSEMIARAADTMTSMVDRLILMTQHQGDGTPFKPEKVDVMRLCREALEMVNHHKTDQHSLEVVGQVDEAVFLDPFLISRILSKLLSNALKYSLNGGKIVLRVARVQRMIRFSVTDEGSGLSPEEVSALFNGYFRAERHQHIPGSGMSLTYVKSFAERHAGTVRCESKLGKGSNFIVEIPLWKPLDRLNLTKGGRSRD